MPSTGDAAGKYAQRKRIKERVLEIVAAGGPLPPDKFSMPGMEWYAANLEPRTFLEVADELEYVGEIEALVVSGGFAKNGTTLQLQVLPAYAHAALDMAQRSTQGVLVAVLFQAPWELFRPENDEFWPQLTTGADDLELADELADVEVGG